MKTIIALIACTAAFVYFFLHSLKFIAQYQTQFEEFLHEYYPTVTERHRMGFKNLQKQFRGYVVSYYFCAAATGYAAAHLFVKLLNRLLS